jgi:hypothetical protein
MLREQKRKSFRKSLSAAGNGLFRSLLWYDETDSDVNAAIGVPLEPRIGTAPNNKAAQVFRERCDVQTGLDRCELAMMSPSAEPAVRSADLGVGDAAALEEPSDQRPRGKLAAGLAYPGRQRYSRAIPVTTFAPSCCS